MKSDTIPSPHLVIGRLRIMNRFNNDRGFKNFSGRSFGNKRQNFGDRGNDRPRMVRAICDKCGRECELPFKPTGDKPVYCSDCFEKMGGRSGGRRFENRDNRDYRQENTKNNDMEMIGKKLDRIIELLSVKEQKEIKKVKKPKKVEKILDLDIKEVEIPTEIEVPIEETQE